MSISSDESRMPSLEEVDECVFQMDSEPPSALPQAIAMHHPPYHILQGIVEPSTQVEIELHERTMKHVREIGEERKRNSLKRRLMMRLRKDGYHASLCRSSWAATTEHPGENAVMEQHVSSFGDYEYIDVVVAAKEEHDDAGTSSSSGSSSRLVVDIDFRSQFQLARPTSRYAQLWARLPAVFVGLRAKLRNAVSLLCAEAQRSLRESGLHVPPWRRSGYMQAKWLPGDVTTMHGGGGARRGPAEEVVAVAQWSLALVREPRGRGGARSRMPGAGGLSMALTGSGVDSNGRQAGSKWA